jgi:hypothetical protein
MEFIFKLKHWVIHPVHLQAFVYLFDPFGGAQIPQNSIKKNIFWFFSTIFQPRMGLLIWLGPFFSSKDIGPIHLQVFVYHFGSIGGCPNAPKQHKITIFWVFWTVPPNKMGLLIW